MIRGSTELVAQIHHVAFDEIHVRPPKVNRFLVGTLHQFPGRVNHRAFDVGFPVTSTRRTRRPRVSGACLCSWRTRLRLLGRDRLDVVVVDDRYLEMALALVHAVHARWKDRFEFRGVGGVGDFRLRRKHDREAILHALEFDVLLRERGSRNEEQRDGTTRRENARSEESGRDCCAHHPSYRAWPAPWPPPWPCPGAGAPRPVGGFGNPL